MIYPLSYHAGKNLIHVVDFADVLFPKILDKFESPRPITHIAECGRFVAWATQGEEVTDSGTIQLYKKFSRVERTWEQVCEFVGKTLKYSVIMHLFCPRPRKLYIIGVGVLDSYKLQRTKHFDKQRNK